MEGREGLFDRLRRPKFKIRDQGWGSNATTLSQHEHVFSTFDARGRQIIDPEKEAFENPVGGRSHSAPVIKYPAALEQSDRGSYQKLSTEPLGLTIVWDPPNPIVDIIFMHGLGGSAIKTWSWEHNLDNFWPSWLSSEPELSRARIHTFGYSSGIAGSSNMMNILDFAKDLLFKMKYEYTQGPTIGSQPIVFVTHSMGGLVAKKAYLTGKNDKEYEDMMSHVMAFIFLSTPHRGGNGAKIMSQILQLFNMSKEYIKELSTNSIFLQNINEDFTNVCEELKLFSFYETMKTFTGASQFYVVDKDSGILNLRNETSAPMVADHHTVCKFPHPEDPRYKDVKNVLKSLVLPLDTEDSRSTFLNTATETKILGDILSINEDELLDELDRFRNLAKYGTCAWIKDKEWFTTWLQGEEDEPHVLWLSGGAAAGKSVLATYIVDSVRKRWGDDSGQYHNLIFSDKIKRSTAYLLRSLAYQVAQGFPLFRARLIQMSEQFGVPFGSMNTATLWEKIFRGILFNMSIGKPLYWVIDSLDESDSVSTFFQCLKSLEAHSCIKILLVSRPTTDITMRIKQLPLKCSIHQISTSDTYNDIKAYVEDTISSIIPAGVATRQEIVENVLAKASGNFLWVSLAMKALEQSWHRQSNIEHALSGLPGEMTPLYARMMQKMDRQDSQIKKMASVFLTWATFSLRPLYISELKIALQPEFPDLTSIEDTIHHICGDFVQVRNSRVSLIHETARHFLVYNNSGNILPMKSSQSHEYLAIMCLQHLCSTREKQWRQLLNLIEISQSKKAMTGKSPSTLEEIHPFLPYAAKTWAYHLSLSRPDSQSLRNLVSKFFKNDSLTWINALALLKDLKTLIRSAQYLKMFIKNQERAKSKKAPENFQSDDIEFLKLWAVDLIKLVGKFGSNLLQNPSSIYKLIPPFCPANSIIRQTFGQGYSSFSVGGISFAEWDDCHARLSVGADETASKLIATVEVFAALVPQAQSLVVWHAETCEELRRIRHGEYVTEVAVNKKGDLVSTSGIKTIKIWELGTGRQVGCVPKHSDDRIIALAFGAHNEEILVGYQDHLIICQNWGTCEIVYAFRAVVKDDPIVHNGLRVVSFSPDSTQVAVASRNRPVDLWDLRTQSRTHRCIMKDEVANVEGDVFLAPEVIQWHPDLGNIFILYHSTTMVDWNPMYEEQTEHEIGAKGMVCSPCGNFLLTSDHRGSVRVFTLPDYAHEQEPKFRLLYHLEYHEFVRDLAFSPDGQRFYDLRGSVCSVWEPDALVQPDSSDADEDCTSCNGTLWSARLTEDSLYGRAPITAIASGPENFGFCYGRDDGTVAIHEMATGKKIRALSGHSADMAIISLEWSTSGNWIASGDDSGLVLVRKIQIPITKNDKVAIYKPFSFRIRDGINQLLFSSDEKYLLVSTSSTDSIWDVSAKRICQTRQHASPGRVKWVEHPTNPSWLVSIGAREAHIFVWNGFVKVTGEEGLQFAPVDDELSKGTGELRAPITPSAKHKDLGNLNLSEDNELSEVVNYVTTTKDRQSIIFEALPSNGYLRDRLNRRRIELIRVADLDPAVPDHQIIPQVSIKELAREVSNLVGSYQNQVVFFNHQHWLCTWEIGTDVKSYKRHLFLPKDWISAETLDLKVLNNHGTLLCPRNGEVAIIKNSIKF